MSTAGIKVLVFGRLFRLPHEVHIVTDVKQLMSMIAQVRPDVILTCGINPGALMGSAFEIRKRWIHVPENSKDAEVVAAIESCYAFNLWTEHPNQKENPLVSVYMGCFNTGDFLRDTYQSLREQTYTNWELVCIDDASTDGTWDRLVAIAGEDPRVRPFRNARRSGKIGEVKDAATRLCRGVYLVECDHDDFLADSALDEIVKAFGENAGAGMVYSNFAAFFQDGSPHRYQGDFWEGRYRWTEYRGKKYLECISPDIYDRFGPNFTDQFGFYLTVSPNHVRAFRASTFWALGGYNSGLAVTDDFDLMARMFLRSRIVHIPKLLYFYRFLDGWANSTFVRNRSIQDHVALVRANYAAEFRAFNEARLAAEKPAEPEGERKTYSTSDMSYVVPEGAPSELTEKCLASIREFSPGSEIVLVSNGQPSLGPARSLADKVVDLEMNLRFAAACNRGAMEASRELVCIINNDCEFVDASPALLAAAVGVKGDIVAPYSNRAKPPQGDIPYEQVPKTDLFPDAVVGVCMVMRTDLYRALGGFDPRLYTWEDDSICAQARALGKKCVVVGGTYVAHERHATFHKRGEDVHAVMAENRKIFEKKHPKIRVIAISKDEETSIRGFFGQFSGITRDWCLLDTGSTDRTIEEARAIGVRIESGPFEDFAQARNEALRRFAQDAEWVIMLDPDERLDIHTLAYLKETFFRTPHDILLAPLHAVTPDGSSREFVPKPFAFRNRPEIRWAFKVHEKLVGSSRQALVVNAKIEHVLGLHAPGRRAASEELYRRLADSEPYFQSPGYRDAAREQWPILDYDRMDDPRVAKIHVGPLVSVVIPTYQRLELLDRAVQSALNQDYANLEVVVMGDGCPNLFVRVASPWAKEPRVREYNLATNHGAGGAVPRNYGIMLSAGELIAYVDDDNALDYDHVSSLYAALRSSGASFAFSSMRVNGKDLGFTEPKLGGIDTSCVVHRKDLIQKYGWWKNRQEAGYHHDHEFFSRWVSGGERWAATGLATVDYNVETCGQKGFIEKLAEAKA